MKNGRKENGDTKNGIYGIIKEIEKGNAEIEVDVIEPCLGFTRIRLGL